MPSINWDFYKMLLMAANLYRMQSTTSSTIK